MLLPSRLPCPPPARPPQALNYSLCLYLSHHRSTLQTLQPAPSAMPHFHSRVPAPFHASAHSVTWCLLAHASFLWDDPQAPRRTCTHPPSPGRAFLRYCWKTWPAFVTSPTWHQSPVPPPKPSPRQQHAGTYLTNLGPRQPSKGPRPVLNTGRAAAHKLTAVRGMARLCAGAQAAVFDTLAACRQCRVGYAQAISKWV